ncbi:hypothetical protein G3O08_00660 [Cryomorpha ignava]|uniref:GTP-binding protein n=1 Tax=Cryomorpha ignava TaxID=101383 RepID=A0A7K3WKJ1_9FLAO|nr:TMEM14 family protein [Cryomorpha ignava]NEN22014.1 hypothetical protein [Cryomorpha ignava]
MSDLKFRPRFKIETELTTDKAQEKIKTLFKTPHEFETAYVKGHFIVKMPEQVRHYWSPQMDVSVYYDDYTETTQVRCLLAPAPNVWTLFMFIYSFAGFGVLFGLLIGSSQYNLGKNPWGFWMALGAFIVAIILFGIAQFGKSISKEEMRSMKKFIYQAEWKTQKEMNVQAKL